MWPNPKETADLVTFTKEILNGKIYFLCSAGNPDLPSIIKIVSGCHLERPNF